MSPGLVADCLEAMRAVVRVPVTITSDQFRRTRSLSRSLRFVRFLHERGTRVFIVHARTAYLTRFSPRDNRAIPPLRPAFVQKLQQDCPSADIIFNGGVDAQTDLLACLASFSGVRWSRPTCLRASLASVGSAGYTLLWQEPSPYPTQKAWLADLPRLVAAEQPEAVFAALVVSGASAPRGSTMATDTVGSSSETSRGLAAGAGGCV